MMRSAVNFSVRAYQLSIGAMMAPSCRFFPSCSNYCLEAVQEHGVSRGLWLTSRRIARCHPWNAGGVDLVPPKLVPAKFVPPKRPHSRG